MTLLAVACLVAGCGEATEPPDLPNFVVVSVDTLRRDSLGAFHPSAQELPEIDAFAEGAVKFDQAFSTASWTLPAQASILTGLYPHHHGAVHRNVVLATDQPTLPELLQTRGYRTAAFTDGGFLDHQYALARGFEVYDELRRRGAKLAGLDLPLGGDNPKPRGSRLFERAIRYLEWLPEDRQPYFLFLQTYSVHDYFELRPWVDASAEPIGIDRSEHYRRCITTPAFCSPEEWKRLAGYYAEEIQHFDRGFGRLLRALDARDQGPTYLLLVSDHGEGFDLEAGRFHHGGRLHDDLIRVPLLLAGPGLAPERVDLPVSLVDIAPTLLELAGIEPPDELDGRSLLHSDVADGERVLYAFEHTHVWRDGTRLDSAAARERPLIVGVITGGYRLLAEPTGSELYSVVRDPGQRQPLDPRELAEARPLLEEARRLLGHRAPLELSELGKDLERELRSLGYL